MTIEKPKISVIMPVYNTEKFLKEAIESVLWQSFCDFEFIIIDDGSTDNSYQICQRYASDDSRIRLYRNLENKWISYTRNKLIELCSTNYIASQDSDDISMPDRLESCYNFLNDNPEFGVVSWNNIIIDELWEVLWYRKYSSDIKNIILKKSPISQGSSMFRKNIFLELWWYDATLNFAEDYDLWLRMYSKGYMVWILGIYLYKVRIRQGQTKSESLKMTIRNTIFVQTRAINDYKISPNTSDKIYHILEKCLLLLPNRLILFLFKNIEYSNEK